MRVYEAVVKGLEGVGVDAAFGGAGENAASLMLALKHSQRIRPVIARHEQAASFMACGYAMYTDRLGVCFATAGPGAFNLFSGLAVAMSDSYPVLAISGYASLDWQGRGSLNETSGINRTPDSRAMFAATTKKSYLLTDIADTCDVLEEAVNVAFEGRPGPVHIHVPENLTEHGLKVENYRDIRLNVAPVRPDPERVEEIATVLADTIARGEPIVALEAKVGEVKPAHVDGQDYEARHIIDVTSLIHPGRLAQSIGRMLPPGAVLLADAGAHLAWLGYYVELAEGQNFRKAGEFGPMAGHVNGALGLKLAHPERTVVVGCGDGCYSLSGFELMTAVQYQIPVIWVVFDDEEFKLIKLYQLEAYHETGLVEFQNPDLAAYARACGADGYRVDTLEDFEAAFGAAITSNRPTVIDAKITRWAVPHYSPSPDGIIAGLVEAIEERFRNR